MTPPNPFDQASRYTAKLDAPGFLHWLLPGLPATLAFRDWLWGLVGTTSAEAGLGHLGALLLIVGCLAFVGTLMGEAVYDRVGRRSMHRG